LVDQDTWGQQLSLDLRAQASCTLNQGQPTRLAVVLSADLPVNCPLDLPARWSMVSLPCVTADNSVAAVFPQARSVWDYDGTYQLASALAPGVGYWINQPSAAQVNVQGLRYPYGTLLRALPAGWAMVGPGEVPLSVAGLRARYPGLVSVFGYAGGYRVAETMAPGQGYWVHLAAPTTLDLSGWGSVARPLATSQPAWTGPRLWVEAPGASQALDLGVPPAAVIALPPVPPAGLFDARVDIAPDIQAWQVPPGGTYRLRLQGEDLRLHWTLTEVTDWQLEIDGVVTPLQGRGELTLQPGAQVWLRSSSRLPLTTQLYACYPNPFNPTTTIRYDLAEPGRVRLRVFAVTGQLVRDLSPGDQPAGTYQLPWDGRDAAGDPVGNGLYLVQLQAGPYQDVTRVAMMK
jgi:hypothetical protein